MLCIEIIRHNHASLNTNFISHQMNSSDRLVNDAIAYIQNHIKENITVDLLANQFNVSNNYLYKSFIKVLHISPKDFIKKQRLALCIDMIISNAYTMEEIASELNFTSAIHFSKFIKKETGYSPKQYQKKMLNE